MQLSSREFDSKQAAALACAGDNVISHYGSLNMALRSVQEPHMALQADSVSNALDFLPPRTELRRDISELRRIGAAIRYRGESPSGVRVRGFPRNMSEEKLTMAKMWGNVQQGKIFACSSRGIPEADLRMVSPSTTVAKKLPDRTLAVDRRVIWDRRRPNLRCPREDYWPVVAPTVEDFARKYCHLKTTGPGIGIVGTNATSTLRSPA